VKLRLLPVLLALSLASPPPARADDASSKAAAQALFESARQLMAQEKYAEACPKFAESERLDPGAGTLLNLGGCYEKLGRTASAWVTFKEAATAATQKHRDDWAQKARDRAAALEPKLSRLTIEVPEGERRIGLTIRRDGVDVGSAEWGVPIPTDPGECTLEATAPSKRPWSTRTTVRPNGDETHVLVPELQDAPAAAAPTTPPVKSSPSPALPAAPPPTESDRGASQRTIGLVALGVGIAGIAAGSIFGAIALGKSSSAKTLCPASGPICASQQGVQDNNDANSAATISTVALAAGGAAVVTGAILFLAAPKRATSPGGERAAALRLTPTFGARGAGLELGGAW